MSHLFDARSASGGGRFSSFGQGSNSNSHSRKRRTQGGDRASDDAFDYQAERKRRRREAKLAEKEARIDAHTRWIEQKRALRARAADSRTSTKNEIQNVPHDKVRQARTNPQRVHKQAVHGPASQKKLVESSNAVNQAKSSSPRDVHSVAGRDANAAATPAATTTANTVARQSVHVSVPAVVKERIRRCVNKLTLSNVVGLTHEISDLFLRSNTVSDRSSATTNSLGISSSSSGLARHKSHIDCTATDKDTPLVITRAAVAAGLMQEVARRCSGESGPLTLTDTLSLAGLLRGMQLLYGSQLGAELVEQLCMGLEAHVRQAEEGASDNMVTVLAQLYLLYGVDADFILSLLNHLVGVATDAMDVHRSSTPPRVLDKQNASSREQHGRRIGDGKVTVVRNRSMRTDVTSRQSDSSSSSSGPQAPVEHGASHNPRESAGGRLEAHPHSSAAPGPGAPKENSVALAATSCALALLRACGDKLLREAGAGLERALQRARQMVATAQTDRSSSSGTDSTIPDTNHSCGSTTSMPTRASSARCEALVSVMADIAAGRTRGARRSVATESEAPVRAMLQHLCALLPGANVKTTAVTASPTLSKTTSQTLRRVVQTASVLTGISWDAIVQPVKPARWFDPSLHTQAATTRVNEEDSRQAERRGTKRAAMSADREAENGSSMRRSGGGGNDGHEEDAARTARRAEIRRMREREEAIAGQRFHTEHRREMFECVIGAADDLDCFNALVQYDPSYSRFPDVCAVLLQCCYQESRYNAYYTQILERFCSARPACAKTLQFAIWDRIKSIRIGAVDVTGYLNLTCLIATLLERGTFTLSLLRGLDLADTNKTLSLFARVLLLRVVLQLPSARLTELFFGGDGWRAHDVRTDTADLRRCLTTFVKHYFIDDAVAGRWVPLFYDVVAVGTPFEATATRDGCAREGDEVDGTAEDKLEQFMTRLNVIYKALKTGIM